MCKYGLFIAIIFLAGCIAPRSTGKSEKEFEVKKIIEMGNGNRRVILKETNTRKYYYTVCECDTVRVGLIVKVNLIKPMQ